MTQSETKLNPPESGVIVRMYNSGFGDCLLLAFPGDDGQARYMLIDCGVFMGYPDAKERMQSVVRDIAAATGNHLHVVAVTHEHEDHISGFRQARDIFDGIAIDDLWLAWTENPKDPVARQLKETIVKKAKALKSAVNRLGLIDQGAASRIQAVLDFGPFEMGVNSKISELDYLRQQSKKKLKEQEDYRRPGETPLTMPGVKGFKFYVLGPPRDPAAIGITDKPSETYLTSMMNEEAAFCIALEDRLAVSSKQDEMLIEYCCPFNKPYEIPQKDAAANKDYGEFFRTSYGFTGEKGQGPEWRRIDGDWLAPSEQLALRINNYTNNTSLVLAIEMPESRDILLFVGDAQVGNWRSWQKVQWAPGTHGEKGVDGGDILNRTVFYKVGHHGSHNATLRQQGLEMMNADKLVAIIPVDQEWAHTVKGWSHPEQNLLDGLEEKAKGRVLRADRISAQLEKPDNIGTAAWQSFMSKVECGPDNLWIQFTVEDK
ncbi:MAG: hypothetical protein NTZ34_05840 [Chloroflexi bacterium]|nr:hypothetical protein [Chloroflexota bacterium]